MIYRAFIRQTLRVFFIVGVFSASAIVFAENRVDVAVKKAVATAVTKDVSDLAGARKIYADNCSVCHGDKGVGSKWTMNTLNPSPRDFTSALAAIELTRERMLSAVIAGREGTAMVSYLGDLSVSDIIAVVDFIRSEFMQSRQKNHSNIAKEQPYVHEAQQLANMTLPFDDGFVGDVVAGRDLYLGNCAACHGVGGDGQGVRKSASQPLPRNFLSIESRQILNRPSLYKGISEGKNGTVMPAWERVLSEKEMADVAEYVFQTFIYPIEGVDDKEKKSTDTLDLVSQGREIYNLRCYFCHGYSGDAKTLASTYLKPEPRAFAAMQPDDMDALSMFDVVKNGKLGTAMDGFSYLLNDQEITAVVKFVVAEFIEKKQVNTFYHIEENGWGEHERYSVAFPFAKGEIPLDTPWSRLTEEQAIGKQLFMSGCITCHDRAHVNNKEIRWQSRSISYPRGKYSHKEGSIDVMSGASPFSAHDRSPQIFDLTKKEAQGQSLFVENCTFCHGGDGKGVNWIGSFLESRPRDLTHDDIKSVSSVVLLDMIRDGVPNTTMPAWKAVLDDDQIEALIAYIRRAFH